MAALALRRQVIPAMAHLAAQIQARDTQAVATFRKVHATALGINLLQLVALVWGVTQLSL